MAELRLHPDSYGADEALDNLRTRAQDLANAGEWATLRTMRGRLEQDGEFWSDLWAPLCALAGAKLGLDGALDELIGALDGGFCQPELFGDELESAFGRYPRWSEVRPRLALGPPPSPLRLLDWPVVTPRAPLGLTELPGRAAELRALRALLLLPTPRTSAWETALATLDWVTHRWKHANAHMEIDDAVECLRRVDAGLRFACVEYTLVLSQSLNALGIPARRLALRQRDHHAGIGRGHLVSEAWIDELGRWVVLDGQNGLYWTSEDGAPLGPVELRRLAGAGAEVPHHVSLRDDFGPGDAAAWFSYFAFATSSAGTYAPEGLGLVFQRDRLVTTNRLEHGPEALYPDLSEVGVESALVDGRPALRLVAAHPYAVGYAADGDLLGGEHCVLDLAPGTIGSSCRPGRPSPCFARTSCVTRSPARTVSSDG